VELKNLKIILLRNDESVVDAALTKLATAFIVREVYPTDGRRYARLSRLAV
jgi:hypothetical protein